MNDKPRKTRAVDKTTLEELRRAARESRKGGDKSQQDQLDRETSADETTAGQPSAPRRSNTHERTPTGDTRHQPETRGRLAAREFAQGVEPNDGEEDAPQLARKKSSLSLIAALIIGGWIIAGGAFFALRGLQADETTDDSSNDELALEAGLEPTPQATPTLPATPTPDINATATPVPPTPVWRPANDGPRSAPFTFTVEAIVNEPRFFDAKDGKQVIPEVNGSPVPLANPTASGAPLVLRVVSGEPTADWAQVALPGAAEIAWVASEDFVWNSTEVLIQINVATNSLVVFEGDLAVFNSPVATGERSRATPQTSTYVLEDASRFGLEGSELFRLAAIGPNAGLDLDGLPTLSIGITDDFTQLGNYVTDGDILVNRSTANELADLVDPGAKVEIFGSPPPPTPTPAPTPTVNIGARTGPPSGGSFGGCSIDAFGTPPNCYRTVERPTVKGECGTSQLELNGSCVLFGGDPILQGDGSTQCPTSAPEEIGGRCYVTIGRVPELPGECPAGSQDVDGECRVPA